MNLKERINNYLKNKSLFGKISDLIFVIFIVAMLFPAGRMTIGGAINRVKALISQPDLNEKGEQMSDEDFEWSLKDINGEHVNLKDHKGKVIFINLWATWCPPCVGEMPEIQKLYDKFKDNDDVAFFLITNDSFEKIKSFINKRAYSFPVYKELSQTPIPFRVKSIPTTFVIDKEGKLVIKKTGAANWGGSKTIKIINELLDG